MLWKIKLVFALMFTSVCIGNAAVTYVNPNPDITYNTNGTQNPGIDLNSDGTMDIIFRLDFVNAAFHFYHLRGLVNGSEAIMDPSLGLNPGGGLPYYKIIAAGTSIGPASANFQSNDIGPVLGDVDNNNIINQGDCIVGLKFIAGGNTHYAWLRLNLTGNTASLVPVVIKDWAYESTPNTAIIAGNMGNGTTNIAVTNISVNGQGGASDITTNNGSLQMVKMITPANATNQAVTWSVTNGSGSATISQAGLLTAQTNGTVTVKATAQDGSNVSGTKIITLSNQSTAPVQVTSIAVDGQGGATAITIDDGILQMNATVLPANATNQNVTWSVTNGTGSATISATGLLSAQTNGTVTVKATAQDGSNVSGTKVITLNNQTADISVTSITVTGENGASSINTPGGSLQMNAAILPSNATNQNVTWYVISSGVGAADISAAGLLTAVTNGTVTVKAVAKDGSNASGIKTISITNQSTTGITEAQKKHFNIYPNPAGEVLNIAVDDAKNVDKVEIFNISGQRVYGIDNLSGTHLLQLNTAALPKGLYLLHFRTTDGRNYQGKFEK